MSQAQVIALPPELRSLLVGLSTAHVADDQKWILAVMRRQGLTVVSLLWRMLGSPQDVLDVYQTTVCRLIAQGPRAIGSNVDGYFYRAAMNAGIEIIRQRKRRRAQWPAVVESHTQRDAERESSHAPDQALQHQDTMERMRRAMCQLPPRVREVILLRDLGELPYRQVARMMGITEGTARLYRHQAVMQLADLLGREMDE
jgi:RNA polymerase sigma-70 factor (ECF subfamily)